MDIPRRCTINITSNKPSWSVYSVDLSNGGSLEIIEQSPRSARRVATKLLRNFPTPVRITGVTWRRNANFRG